MRDLRRISIVACVFLVVLRMAIGWQFLYEGLWKWNTLDGPTPWTAAGYLKNAKGPFRDHYREMTGDPNDLDWLNYDKIAAGWDDWHQRFLAHYPDLTDEQKSSLDRALNGPARFTAPLKELPPSVKIDASLAKVVSYDADKKLLVVDGKMHLLPAERDKLLGLATVKDEDRETPEGKIVIAYHKAVNDVFKRASVLSYKERLTVSLKADPSRAGEVVKARGSNEIAETRMGDIELYKQQIDRYEANLAQADTAFKQDHVQKQWGELQALRARLVGPVKALDDGLKADASKILTVAQQSAGPVTLAKKPIDQVDQLTILALIILGALLISGLFSRLAAIAGAGMLLSFYLAMPPWPGVVGFQELPGPEHSYIVDKNLIEVIALLAIAALPTGRWFGIGRIFRGLFGRSNKASTTKT